MPHIEHNQDVCRLIAPGLILQFQRRTDRWVQEIRVGPAPERLIQSVDLEAERSDPERVVSPTYQELDIQSGSAGPQVLLVGRSGPHHFSGVVTLRDEPEGVILAFDVADRCRSPIRSLSATYVLDSSSGDLLEGGPLGLVWGLGRNGTSRWMLEPLPPATLVLAEAGRCGTRVQVLAGLNPAGSTHRLAYRWRWVS